MNQSGDMDQLMAEKLADHPPTQRRPRVREVSSRFMSPPVTSPASSPRDTQSKQRSCSVNRTPGRRRQLDLEPLHDNSRRSMESPLPQENPKRLNFNSHKPLKENGGPRPDTPMTMSVCSRFRLIQQHRSNSTSASATAAAKLLQSSGMSSAGLLITDQQQQQEQQQQEEQDTMQPQCLRSSADTVSSRHLIEKRAASPICSRSLNSSSSDHLLFQSINKFSKPPVPPCAKLPLDVKKGKKVSGLRDDSHSLRLLQNRYLQWRYANAMAEASMLAQQRQTEKTLYSLALKIEELYDSVKRKRIELGILQRAKTLSTILEAQVPYLDQWFALQEDYSVSLGEATQALLNASLRLPISDNVRANKQELEEALNSAIEVMEMIAFHVQKSIPKAEETENFISELARVFGGERALIEECGNLLVKTYSTQVEECSLRGHIIQLNQRFR